MNQWASTVLKVKYWWLQILSLMSSLLYSHQIVKRHLISKHMLEHIINTFTFTSFSVKCEKDLCKRNKGIYTFKVQGQFYHYVNDLLPPDGHSSYLQLYFYDANHEVENRIYQSLKLRPNAVQKLMEILTINPYCDFFDL